MRSRRQRYESRTAWLLENDRIRLALLEGGGHLAEIALAGKRPPAGINPLWQPPWKTMEPYRFSLTRDGPRYGNDRESRLLSGICGHNVCFDYWGPPSPDEMHSGLSFHGEAGVIRWKAARRQTTRSLLEFTCVAEMALSAARLTRTVRLRPGETVAYFEETAENLTALNRAIGWVQHVSIGPPFLQRGATRLDLPATHGCSLPGGVGRVAGEVDLDWPYVQNAGGGEQVDLRVAAPEQRSGFVLNLLIDPARKLGFVAAVTPKLRLLAAYVFRRDQFPWVNHWEHNRQARGAPWKGRALAVGLEFGNTIVAGSRRAMAAFPQEKYGVPTYGWLPARGSQTVRYVAMLAEVPRDFGGTADIRAVAGGLTIVERDGAGREFHVPCDSGFLG